MKKPVKILFLDIDGVLWTASAALGYEYAIGPEIKKVMDAEKNFQLKRSMTWNPCALYNLYKIVEQTGCKIVISSTWRRGKSLRQMKSWFRVPLLKKAVLGKTPTLDSFYFNEEPIRVPRGSEIEAWCNDYKRKNGRDSIEKIAILDDDSDMYPLEEDFFKTPTFDGLLWHKAEAVIQHLGAKNES